MRYLVLSDIHANLEALEAVLAEAAGFDRALVLGDVVGYGADPNAVVDRLRGIRDATFIRGNHDKVATGLESVTGFNHLARHAIEWTASALTPDNRDWVAALGHGHVPAAFCLSESKLQPVGQPRGTRFSLPLEPSSRYLVNCGAVGQPRD